MADKTAVIEKTAISIIWWLEERKKKLREHLTDSMSVNPFLLPVLFDLHNSTNLEELNKLMIVSHLMTGHNTGFGKLVDEKILPDVFGTQKLDAKFRHANKPYNSACFDEVDHLVPRKGSAIDLLSLKAGKWTIQLTMAVQLNSAFREILATYPGKFHEIAVGVFYGKRQFLTDKYDILRGVNRGKGHGVHDLTKDVNVYAGREFWAWLNNGEQATQEWVLDGLLDGLKQDNSRDECGKLLAEFNKGIVKQFSKYVSGAGSVDWSALLNDING